MRGVIEALEVAAPGKVQLVLFLHTSVHTVEDTASQLMQEAPLLARHIPMEDTVDDVDGFTDVVSRGGIAGLGAAFIIGGVLFLLATQRSVNVERDAPLFQPP